MNRDVQIINEYSSICTVKRLNERWDYLKSYKTIEDLLYTVSHGINEKGGIEYHQRRIKKTVMDIFYKKLIENKNNINSVKSFGELYNIIESIGNTVSGVGDTFIFDSAFRIAYYLNIYPDKIYLHAGTRIGVEGLLNKKINTDFILKNDLPEPYKSCQLNCTQLEDLFCAFKYVFINKDPYNGYYEKFHTGYYKKLESGYYVKQGFII